MEFGYSLSDVEVLWLGNDRGKYQHHALSLTMPDGGKLSVLSLPNEENFYYFNFTTPEVDGRSITSFYVGCQAKDTPCRNAYQILEILRRDWDEIRFSASQYQGE